MMAKKLVASGHRNSFWEFTGRVCVLNNQEMPDEDPYTFQMHIAVIGHTTPKGSAGNTNTTQGN